MFDDVIDIFSLQNLFAPLSAFFQDLRGPCTHFGVASMAGKTKRQVRQILEGEGIAVWGDIYDGYQFIFTVPKDREKEAYRVLVRNNVAVIFPKFELEG